MAIERHDRSFHKIFSEITLEKIPTDYIEAVSIELTDGSRIEIDGSELLNAEAGIDDILSGLVKEEVVDVAIAIDYDKIQADVEHDVKFLLAGYFDEGSELDDD